MKINTTENVRPDSPDATVSVKIAGNVIEVRYMNFRGGSPVQKINKDYGMDLRTGEVIEYRHNENRSQDTASVAQSLKRLRDLINMNTRNYKRVLWVTLTYKDNMTDENKLYQDYRKFWQRFLRYLRKNNHPKAEYIAAAEPQERGAWHLHCLFIFPQKAPFIPNADLERIWKNGFTKTKSLKGVDNPGLYLTAYLGDMEYEAAKASGNASGRIVELEDSTTRKRKAIVKGARLHLYPPGFNLYRHSRGIALPITFETTEHKAMEIVGSAKLTYEKTIRMTDEVGNGKKVINYRQYNCARKE